MGERIQYMTPREAVSIIKSGDHIHLGSVASTPGVLIDAMCEHAKEQQLRNIHIRHLHTEAQAQYADPEYEGIFQLDSFFVGKNVRENTQAGYADYIPIFLGETAKLYRRGVLPVTVVLIEVSPPDASGYVSLGTAVDTTLAAIEMAKTVIAVINPQVPRALGDALIPLRMIDRFVAHEEPLYEAIFGEPTPQEIQIGKNCAELIEDGATLQMGIGNIPNAVLSQLGNHKDLGIHTEMFADGVIPLIKSGVITGAKKRLDRHKIVSTFLMGRKSLYEFIDNNPEVMMRDVEYTNDPFIIAQNPRVTAINSALEVDLTGQVCAGSLGRRHFSGVGGQVDFIYGASRSEGGKPIIAMPSITAKGVSKIVDTLQPGAGVVTTRAHMHWLVTEYGAVNLYGRSFQERARLIISVAHPDMRETLDQAAFERFGSHFYYIRSKT